ncbi:hypothetical protein M3Y99_00055500 [Aphelenchoides fujianensis]|nr:hypothetical protein M3Y99_00055500 [Aphelenchoides fujianensis]
MGAAGLGVTLVDYQKAAAANPDPTALLAGGTTGGSPNSTSCTSGVADLSWPSNESAQFFNASAFGLPAAPTVAAGIAAAYAQPSAFNSYFGYAPNYGQFDYSAYYAPNYVAAASAAVSNAAGIQAAASEAPVYSTMQNAQYAAPSYFFPG